MEGGRVLGIAGNVKFASVSGNEGIPAHKPFWWETEVKLAEDVAEGFREKFCTLLDEGGRGRDLIGQEIEIFQQFMPDAAAFHAEEEMDQLYESKFAVTGKILAGVFDKPGSIAGHGVHDCPKCGLDLLRK